MKSLCVVVSAILALGSLTEAVQSTFDPTSKKPLAGINDWRAPKYLTKGEYVQSKDAVQDLKRSGSAKEEFTLPPGAESALESLWSDLSPSEKEAAEDEIEMLELEARCGQTPELQSFSGWTQFVYGQVPALGNYGGCKQFPLLAQYLPGVCEKSPATCMEPQWCSATPVFVCADAAGRVIAESTTNAFNWEPCSISSPYNSQQIAPLGMCVNNQKTCPPKDLNRLLYNISKNPTKEQKGAGAAWAWGGRCVQSPEALIAYGCSANTSFTYMEAKCDSEEKQWYDDHGAVTVFGFLMFMLFLVVVSSVVLFFNDWAKDCRREALKQDSLNRTEGDDETTALIGGENINQPPAKKDAENNDVEDPLPKTLVMILRWFDLRSSISDLFTVRNRNLGDTDTRWFEGVRFAAMLFVVYGHSMVFPWELGTGVTNFLGLFNDLGNQYMPGVTINPAYLAVDTFFFLSGFLFLHLYMKRIQKDHAKKCKEMGVDESEVRVMPLGPISSIKMYVHRYLRLTPLVMAVLVVATWLVPYLPVSSPLTSIYKNSFLFSNCKDGGWWRQLLYIGNLETAHGLENDQKHDHAGWNACMGHYWYLDCDMQLFIIAPIIAAVYVLFKPAFFVISLAGIIAGAVTGGKANSYLGGNHNLNYIRPWFRAAAYVWGFVAAAIIRQPQVRNALKKFPVRAVCYLFGTACLVSSINLLWAINQKSWSGDDHKSKREFSQGWALFAWGGGMCLMTLPWATGHGGLLPRFLSAPVFAVMSKLTFAMYLIHPVIMMVISSSQASIPTWNWITVYANFGSFFFWAGFSAICCWVLIEYPFAKMNDLLTK